MKKVTFTFQTTMTAQIDDDLEMSEFREMITGLEFDEDHPKINKFDVVDFNFGNLKIEDVRQNPYAVWVYFQFEQSIEGTHRRNHNGI